MFAFKVFIRLDGRKLIRVYCDNTTAVAYIDNMGGMLPQIFSAPKFGNGISIVTVKMKVFISQDASITVLIIYHGYLVLG